MPAPFRQEGGDVPFEQGEGENQRTGQGHQGIG